MTYYKDVPQCRANPGKAQMTLEETDTVQTGGRNSGAVEIGEDDPKRGGQWTRVEEDLPGGSLSPSYHG